MITKTKNGFLVECDGAGCKENFSVFGDYDDLFIAIWAEGWRITKDRDGEWVHFCQKCRSIAEDEEGYVALIPELAEWLKEHEYDGLCRDLGGEDWCGCGLNDFAPCDNGPHGDCQPAYRHTVDGETVYSSERD